MEVNRKARTVRDKYRTVDELAFSLGRSIDWVRRRLRVLKDNGYIEVGRVVRPNIADVMCPRVAYCITAAAASSSSGTAAERTDDVGTPASSSSKVI